MIFAIYLVCIIFLVIDFKKEKYIISPIKLFNFIWLIILSLYYLNLSYNQQTLSSKTLLIFFLCIFFFNITCYFFSYMKKNNNGSENKTNKKIKWNYRYNLSSVLKIVDIAFITIFLIECIYSKGFPLLFKVLSIGSNYSHFGIPSVHGVLNGIAITLCVYYLMKKDKKAIIYIIFAILTISRQVIISMALQYLIVSIINRYKDNKKINYKKILIYVVIIITGFAIVGNFRSGSNTMNIIFRPRYDKIPNFVMWLYSYTEFSLSNFNNLVSKTSGFVNYGASSLNFFLPTVVLNMINIKPNWNTNYLVNPAYSVSTWFPELYLDFGIIGIVLFSVFIGWLGSYLFKKVTKNPNDTNSLLYAVYSHNILLFFFVNMFLYIPNLGQFLYIILIFNRGDNQKNEIKQTS